MALVLYDMAFEYRPWSVFGDTEKVAAYNPARRVPTLVLDDGEILIDSWAIIDGLDGLVGPERAMFPPNPTARRAAMKVCALAVAAADKAVSIVYELNLHQRGTPMWMARCREQMASVLGALEADRTARTTPYWFGDTISHADIMAACALRFMSEAHKDVIDLKAWPALAAHSARCEALPAFQRIQQPYTYTPPNTA